MLESVVVKQLTTLEQIEQVLALEQEIWKQSYEPMHTALKQSSSSVLLIGAYLNGQLIGFNYSKKKDEHLLYSYLLGIKREYREKGVGELIKLKQKEVAEELGLRKCKWLFEPLEAYTAHLYFTKLRGYSVNYFENHSVETGKALVHPIDRLEVELDIHDDDYLRWDAKIEELDEEAVELVTASINAAHFAVLGEFDALQVFNKDAYTVPIPTKFSKMALESPQLAEEWRMKTREIFKTLLNQDYVILKLTPINNYICRYLFVKRSLFAL